MRVISRRFGAAVTCSEMLLDSTVLGAKKKLARFFTVAGDDHPVLCQVIGNDPVLCVEATRRLLTYGYDAVDFRGLGDELNIWKLPEFSTDAAATANRIAAAGLAVSCFSSGARMFDPDAGARGRHVEEVAEYARLCPVFGAGIIRVFGGKTGGVPVAEAIGPSVEALRAWARERAVSAR